MVPVLLLQHLENEESILQMDLDGRPDGQRPHGHESLLEYYQAEAIRHERNEAEGEFGLDERETVTMTVENFKWVPNKLNVAKGTEVLLQIRSYDATHRFDLKM